MRSLIRSRRCLVLGSDKPEAHLEKLSHCGDIGSHRLGQNHVLLLHLAPPEVAQRTPTTVCQHGLAWAEWKLNSQPDWSQGGADSAIKVQRRSAEEVPTLEASTHLAKLQLID